MLSSACEEAGGRVRDGLVHAGNAASHGLAAAGFFAGQGASDAGRGVALAGASAGMGLAFAGASFAQGAGSVSSGLVHASATLGQGATHLGSSLASAAASASFGVEQAGRAAQAGATAMGNSINDGLRVTAMGVAQAGMAAGAGVSEGCHALGHGLRDAGMGASAEFRAAVSQGGRAMSNALRDVAVIGFLCVCVISHNLPICLLAGTSYAFFRAWDAKNFKESLQGGPSHLRLHDCAPGDHVRILEAKGLFARPLPAQKLRGGQAALIDAIDPSKSTVLVAFNDGERAWLPLTACLKDEEACRAAAERRRLLAEAEAAQRAAAEAEARLAEQARAQAAAKEAEEAERRRAVEESARQAEEARRRQREETAAREEERRRQREAQAREAQGYRKCSKGHQMVPDSRDTNLCDSCEQRGTLFRCASGCDYDLCSLCISGPGPLPPHADVINVGDRVRVHSGITPFYGWGSVKASSVGVVCAVSNEKVLVDFEEQKDWVGRVRHMKLVEKCRLRPGAKVRVKASVTTPKHGWGPVKATSIGTLHRIDSDGDVLIDFKELPLKYWTGRISEIELVAGPSGGGAVCSIPVGARVRVKPTVSRPRYEWGPVGRTSIGTLQSVLADGDVIIRFPEHPKWKGRQDEIEPAGDPGPEEVQLRVGARVRVRACVSTPRFGWRGVRHSSVGAVQQIDSDGDVWVEFEDFRPDAESLVHCLLHPRLDKPLWRGRCDELEVVP